MQPYDNRLRAWERVARDLPLDKLEAMVQPASLGDLPQLGEDILAGRIKGRVVVDCKHLRSGPCIETPKKVRPVDGPDGQPK